MKIAAGVLMVIVWFGAGALMSELQPTGAGAGAAVGEGQEGQEGQEVPDQFAATSSIGTVVPAWIIQHPAHTVRGYYPATRFVFVAAIANGPCAVEAMMTDLVTEPRRRCFASTEWGAQEGYVVVPLPIEPEMSVKVGSSGRWTRVPHLRRNGDLDRLRIGGKVRRRAVRR